MEFSVIKSAQAMVRPAEPTPRETLDLSAIDKLPGLRCKVQTFHVFRYGRHPAKVIKEALSRALVHYYPLAGRLSESDDGELQIYCSGDGVWFVEASASCTLEGVSYLDQPFEVKHGHGLLPTDPAPDMDHASVLLMMQVTEFKCGGFVIGLESCHTICDGLGAAQFLIAVGELARGMHELSRKPAWLREAIPVPPKLLPPPPPIPNQTPIAYQLRKVTIDVAPDAITAIKNRFLELTGQRCSAFEALAATVWQCRARAIASTEKDFGVKLLFFANARQLVHPPLPDGFYGNCFFPVTATSPCKELVEASIVEVVSLVKQAKARLPEDFARWVAGGGGEDDPYMPAVSYGTLFVSEWGRLGFNDVDYGWGKPMHIAPVAYSDSIPVCLLGSVPAPGEGVRLTTYCVEKRHLAAFHELVQKSLPRI